MLHSAETVRAVAGAHNINAEEETQQELRLRKFTRHPFFDKDTLRFDVATINFSNTFSLNQYVQVRSATLYNGYSNYEDVNCTGKLVVNLGLILVFSRSVRPLHKLKSG